MCCWNGFATHFVENGSIVMYVAWDGFYKIGDGNFHDQLIPNQPQKKSSIKWHWVLRGGSIYKMGSTKWCGPTPATLKTRWISILFCARPHPFCRGNWRGDLKTWSDWFIFSSFDPLNIPYTPSKITVWNLNITPTWKGKSSTHDFGFQPLVFCAIDMFLLK